MTTRLTVLTAETSRTSPAPSKSSKSPNLSLIFTLSISCICFQASLEHRALTGYRPFLASSRFFSKTTPTYFVCGGQRTTFWFFPPPQRSQGSNLGQAWQQVPLPTEPSWQPQQLILRASLHYQADCHPTLAISYSSPVCQPPLLTSTL